MIENKKWNKEEAASIAVAETSREETWKSKSYMGSIFMGDFDIQMAFPFPEQAAEDKKIGDEICAKVDAWCKENLDGNLIDETETIPAHVWKGLADLNLFAIKIPQKYGGLGMSQTNYMRILSVVANYCGSTTATLSAHQSIGVPQPLKLAGTPEQKEKFLPRFAKGAISAFALTEPGVGSDPANMSTTAEKSEDGSHWIINGEKLWCTNGVVADIIIVMAKTGEKQVGIRTINKISAFVVETNTPGFEIIHRCRFMGLKAIENGLLRFTNVKVPADNLIGGEGKGLKVALATLNDGRLGIPAIAASTTEEMTKFCAKWAKSRSQWGKQVGKHEAGADKLARLSSGSYAMGALSAYCAALSDEGKQDIRMEAAAAKMFNSELSWDLADTALQLRGGRGYEMAASLAERGESPFPMERALRDARINRIVEGTTDVMHLFLAREALDGHMKHAKPLFSKSSMGTKINTLFKCMFIYAFWLPKLFFPSFLRPFSGFDSKLKPYLRAADRRSKRLARSFFLRMLLKGPGLADHQLTLARIVDIGTEISVMGLVAARIQGEINRGERKNISRGLYWLRSATLRIDKMFRELSRNSDALANSLAAEILAEAEELPAVNTDHLRAHTAREFGSELCTGQASHRNRNKTGPAAAK
ncbi:MAG: acyl-CoA dehydrogenase family protein [Myxococcota bacterium]|nr:acyl-CoA dehydrogenase family protein [Myxococcota bacterium]